MQMGCSSSKVDNEEVVLLCKERKQLIKQAVNRRYDLAAAHVEYIHSLGSIGNALRQFVEGEVRLLASIEASSASPSTTSPEKKSIEHASLPEKSSTTSSLHLHSDSHSHSHQSPTHSQSHSPSSSDENPSESPIHFHHHSGSPIHFHDHSESPPSYASPTRMDYLRSTNTPSRSYEERPVSPDRVTWNSYAGDNQYGMNNFFGIPMGPAPSNSAPPQGPSYSPNHPPPPPSPKNDTWEFLNPFITYGVDNVYPYYAGSRFSPGSEGSSRDSKHVREEEGIPDLEEEDQGNDEKNKEHKEKKVAEKDQSSNKGSPDDMVETTSRSVMQPNPSESVEENLSSKDTEKGAAEKADRKSGDMLVDKGVLPNGDVNQENLDVFVTHGTRNFLEVIKDIESEFKSAQDSGNEVAKMLETNRVPYRPKFNVLKVLSARVLHAITWHRFRPSEALSSKQFQSSKPKKKIEQYNINDLDEDCGMQSGSHSSTLDKIYVWETKLYEEVKAGEKIRIECQKKVNQLKRQTEKGDDRELVEATKTAIKSLETKIKVAIQVVDQVSTRIHKLRDEELQPQIAELIHGFIRMWRVMFDCHQKQHKIISEAKFLGHFGANGISSELHLKATMQLENELHNWHTCFSNWIRAQREYVQALNGWLLKCLNQKPEETDDGTAPFSPRRVGAPPVFIICNDWSQELENMPEHDVSTALDRFREAVKKVLEHQDEEQRQKRKVEISEKDLKRKLVSVEKVENRLHQPQVSSDKKHESETGQTSSILSDQKMSLDSFRKQVDQENAKQREVMQEARKFTLNSLETCLKPVFEAIAEFSESSLKTYVDLSVHYSKENFSHLNGEISHVKNA